MAQAETQAQTFIVLEDHDSTLSGVLTALKKQYPDSQCLTAKAVDEVLSLLKQEEPDLLLMDLSIPLEPGKIAQTKVGLDLLKTVVAHYPELNIVVQSAYVNHLQQVKPLIDTHRGGFTIVDKSSLTVEMLLKVGWALKGAHFTPPEIRVGLELKPEWLQVIEYGCGQCLQDKAIAELMNVADRQVRNYWTCIQDALQVYPDQGINLRMKTCVRAREVGLLD